MSTAIVNVNITESVQGRKPRLTEYVSKFIDKHGPKGKHGMRFHGQKGIADIEAAIQALTALKQQVTIPVIPADSGVVAAPLVVSPVAPETANAETIAPASEQPAQN